MKRLGTALFFRILLIPVGLSFPAAADIDIPFEKFTLGNGLTLIVHKDKKAPIVAINVWYHVGSKNEKPGRTGFAHLFEHLMFNGTENYNNEFFAPLQRVGATGMNGTTNFDRTNYFEVVPKNALDLALFMESDRMGHLLGVVDQERLDEQRGVVQNEKRQGENQPYGRVYNVAFEGIFPPEHPYSWPTIGSMEDLNAASLEDVREWFSEYYGAANAVIVVAGDVDTQHVKARVQHYFGHIPAGPALTRQTEWIPDLRGIHRQVMQDRVPQARLYKFWVMPGFGRLDATRLDLVAGVLSEGKTSRLYKRLVHEEQIASDVRAFAFPLEIVGVFGVQATAMPGIDLADLDEIIEEEIARFQEEGPTEDELKRVVTTRRSSVIRGVERIGGFGGKSDLLARNQVYTGDPAFYQTILKRWNSATAEDLKEVAEEWMKRGQFVLEVVPYGDYPTVAPGADRSRLPETGSAPKTVFDDFERFELGNGLRVVLAQRRAVPVVNLSLMVKAGFSADYSSSSGTASLALNMLDEGTKSRTALEISDETSMLGATLRAGSNLDISSVSMSALKENLDSSLDLFADVILNPNFPQADFERLQKRQLVGIRQEKARPQSMALRIFPKLIYGKNHPYGLPFTGSGTEISVAKLTTNDLTEFHETWFKPNNATLLVVGDITRTELEPVLSRKFTGWLPGAVPKQKIGTVAHRKEEIVYILDRSNSEQSMIFAGHVAPPRDNDSEAANVVMNQVLGGDFMSRINMNLREEKNWSYGARTQLVNTKGQRIFLVVAPVQTDKTKEAMIEIKRELEEISHLRPPDSQEIERVKEQRTLSLPGRWETAASVLNSIAEVVHFGLPDDYWNKYVDSIRALTQAQITAAARNLVRPDRLVWVVVGDRSKIEPGIRALGHKQIIFLDADGNEVVME